MKTQSSARFILLLLIGADLALAHRSPSRRCSCLSANQQQVQALATKTGAVADVLTIDGENFFVIDPPRRTWAVNFNPPPDAVPDEDVSEPFENLAIVYYLEQPRKHAPVPG